MFLGGYLIPLKFIGYWTGDFILPNGPVTKKVQPFWYIHTFRSHPKWAIYKCFRCGLQWEAVIATFWSTWVFLLKKEPLLRRYKWSFNGHWLYQNCPQMLFSYSNHFQFYIPLKKACREQMETWFLFLSFTIWGCSYWLFPSSSSHKIFSSHHVRIPCGFSYKTFAVLHFGVYISLTKCPAVRSL